MAAPTGTLLLKNISYLYTGNDELGEMKDAAIAIKGNVIEWVGPTSAIPPEHATADKTVDLKGCVVLPGVPQHLLKAAKLSQRSLACAHQGYCPPCRAGLVNTHCHMFQSLTRCIAQVSKAGSMR
jgi:8-oxoguanine deaminase